MGVDSMPFIEGEDRNQINLLPYTLNDYVNEDNPVRVIDAYVDSLNLKEIGFKTISGQNAGQKPYRREDLLKLYIYGYLNRIRSSRRMEMEATRNIEVIWLIGRITPVSGFLKTTDDETLIFITFNLLSHSLFSSIIYVWNSPDCK